MIELKQTQRQVQELRMTPQLQQAIKLLQLSRLELVDLIQQEMVENPMLEERAEELEPSGDMGDQPSVEEMRRDRDEEQSREDTDKAVEEIDWERYLENYSSPLPAGVSKGSSDEPPIYEQTLSNPDTLARHLFEQLGVLDIDDEQRQIAEMLIGNLDEQGYLREFDVEEFAAQEGVTRSAVNNALTLVQSMDPLGVGARDLSECLLIQARELHPNDKIMQRVISDHIPDLERRNYRRIASELDVTQEDVMAAHRRITELEPRPGRPFADSDPTYITPDIYVVKRDGRWTAVLNEDGLPRLRVSKYYRDAVRDTAEKDAKQYIQEKLRGAFWLIRSIQQRQRTIVKVTEAIVERQIDFFEKGVKHLRPLVLREIAEDVDMHESTISRVTTNKYVHTPRGTFELKYFFNSSIQRHDGDDIAAEAVKTLIERIIDDEPPRKPYSDQKIVEQLAERHGIKIARRTVAKYRESLGILASSRRRRPI